MRSIVLAMLVMGVVSCGSEPMTDNYCHKMCSKAAACGRMLPKEVGECRLGCNEVAGAFDYSDDEINNLNAFANEVKNMPCDDYNRLIQGARYGN